MCPPYEGCINSWLEYTIFFIMNTTFVSGKGPQPFKFFSCLSNVVSSNSCPKTWRRQFQLLGLWSYFPRKINDTCNLNKIKGYFHTQVQWYGQNVHRNKRHKDYPSQTTNSSSIFSFLTLHILHNKSFIEKSCISNAIVKSTLLLFI